jgi:hypothetical protein
MKSPAPLATATGLRTNMDEEIDQSHSNGKAVVDRIAEIEQLAALDPIDYEAARVAASNRLGIRSHILDKQVAKTRRALGLADNADDGQGRAVKIVDPLPWPESVDGDRVAETLVAAIKTYAVISDEQADTIALWVLQTWLIGKFTIAPRLAVTSPTKGCGKTTVLRFLNKVARRAKRAGSISPPALFRAVEQLQPTILLDETEKYIEHGSELHALLNEGHCSGATVLRVLGDNLELREFSVFGAAAFARNGKLPDDLEQRSIIIEMQRRRPDEALAELRDDKCGALDDLARMCARWADDNADLFVGAEPDMDGLINRTADNWRPLFAIADEIGSDWPDRARAAATVLAPRESQSTGTLLLADIQAAFDDRKTDRLSSEEICEALITIEGRPWAEFGKARKPISKNQLARLLNDFHVKPDNIRIGTRVPKGYRREQFDGVWQRYLTPQIPQGVSEPLQRHTPTAAGTSEPFQTATPVLGVADEKCEKPPSNEHCSNVAVQKQDNAPTRACAQCGASDDGSLREHQGAWLHPECIRFWSADSDLEIPDFLDRRQAAGRAS